jgi:hypothetical protein
MRTLHRSPVFPVAVTSILFSLACDSKGPQEPPPTPTITVSAGTQAVDVQQGGAATVGVNITRAGGYTGAVTIAAENVPAGVTVSSGTIAAGQNSATLDISAQPSAAAATTNITLRATGTGVAAQTTSFALTVREPPGIAIALNPTTLSLAQGQSGSTAVTLTRGGGFTGAVTVTAEGLPAGVTIAPATIATGATAATLNVVTTAASPAGSHPITLRAAGTGVTDQTATLTLQITAPASIQLALAPTSVQVQQGASSTIAATVTRAGGFTGAVTVTAEGLPAGVTIAPATIAAGSTTANLNVSATSGAAVGTSTATIRATGTGVTAVTAPLSIQVTAGSSPGGNVTYRFCPDSGLPLWVAAQDGSGAWTRLTGNANNEYSFQVTTRGALAYVLPQGTGYDLEIFYGTTAEFQLAGADLCSAGTGNTRTINGTVTGLSGTEAAYVTLGNASAFVIPGFGTSFTFTDVQPGVVDLLGARFAMGDDGFDLNRLFLQRNLNPPNNGSVSVDFNGPNSFNPVSHTLTIGNLQGDEATKMGFFRTANGSMGLIEMGTESTSATQQYRTVPSSVQQAGDLHFLMVIASEAGNDDPTHYRTVMQSFATAGNRTINFGPILSNVTLQTLASSPYARLRASYTVQSEYGQFFGVDYQQATRSASLQMSAGYLAGNTTAQLDIPDFSGVAGWNSTWGLRGGTPTEWTFTATSWTGAGTITNPFTDNAIYTSASRTGTIVP